MGFGLLGAAASTIIRESGAERTNRALVTDLPLLIIRGLTAAIVVFLAIKGGLTVFAATPTDPNPYVLLLTCLVAAVFSEPVWEAARVYLTGLMTRWGKPPENEANGGGEDEDEHN